MAIHALQLIEERDYMCAPCRKRPARQFDSRNRPHPARQQGGWRVRQGRKGARGDAGAHVTGRATRAQGMDTKWRYSSRILVNGLMTAVSLKPLRSRPTPPPQLAADAAAAGLRRCMMWWCTWVGGGRDALPVHYVVVGEVAGGQLHVRLLGVHVHPVHHLICRRPAPLAPAALPFAPPRRPAVGVPQQCSAPMQLQICAASSPICPLHLSIRCQQAGGTPW